MDKTSMESKIEALFRRQAGNDSRVRNAYLLVHSDKSGIHLNIAEGADTHPGQPNHMASAGKLFTACIIAIN